MSKKKNDTRDGANIARREFVMKSGVAVGAAALATMAAAKPAAAAEAQRAAQPAGPAQAAATDLPKPAKLLPGAALDGRFPVSFHDTVSQGFRLLTEYFTAMSQRDLAGVAKTLHFPFAIYEEIEPIVYQTEAEFMSNPPPSLNTTGKGLSRVNPGSYDLLESMNVHLYCPVGGAFSLSFKRYTKDGQKLFDCDGIYSVTNNDGRWAIQLVSTIIHERGFEHYANPQAYAEAETADRVGNQGYLSAFGYRDEELLNDLGKSRGSFEPRLPVGTRTAGVNLGYSPRDRTRDARDNNPMKGWKIRGVKSRLTVGTVTANQREQRTDLAEFVDLAGETVGPYGYTRINPAYPLAIHATHDKAHILGGYWRFTWDSVLISETRSVGIRVWKAGNWGSAGGLGQVTHHDRSNSKA